MTRDETPALSGLAGAGRDRRVLVVGGRDERALAELEAMLRRWQVEPLILGQLPFEGQTVIEELAHYREHVAFGVVLATPDDEGHRRGRPDAKRLRGGQHVVLELGMLLASPGLGPGRVAILLQDAVERPSDIEGLTYIGFRDSVTEAGTELAKVLTRKGIPIALQHL